MKRHSGKEELPGPKALGRRRRFGGGICFVGDKGTIVCGGWAGSPRIVPESGTKAYKRPSRVIPRLRQLEDENRKLKNLVADLSLDKAMLQDVMSKKSLKPVRKRALVHYA